MTTKDDLVREIDAWIEAFLDTGGRETTEDAPSIMQRARDHIAAQETRIASLQSDLDEGDDCNDRLRASIADITRQRDAALKDAEKYRTWRAAIESAIAQSKEGE